MIKRLRILGCAISGLIIVLVVGALLLTHSRIDANFATEAKLRYHYNGKSIDVKISNRDLTALKGMLVGLAYFESGKSCGYDCDVSITLTDGRKSIVFCPACDTCASFRVGRSGHRYISVSHEQRKRFDAIVAKYGMRFPCV